MAELHTAAAAHVHIKQELEMSVEHTSRSSVDRFSVGVHHNSCHRHYHDQTRFHDCYHHAYATPSLTALSSLSTNIFCTLQLLLVTHFFERWCHRVATFQKHHVSSLLRSLSLYAMYYDKTH